MIKVSGLGHRRKSKSDPRITWFMFHKIYCMYSDINNKEEINADMLLTSMSEHRDEYKVKEELKGSLDNDDNNQPILQKMIIPSDINDFQPRSTQVWNCDEVWFHPNEIWIKGIYTYKFFQGKRMEKVKTGERLPFWCTLFVFNRADGKCLMRPIIVNQVKY